MLKLIVIALLCASMHQTSAVINATIAREVKLQHPKSYTVAIDSHLYTMATNFTHLLVDSTAENFQPCAIDFEDHGIQKRIEATTIDRKIIVWGVRAKYENKIDHTVLIVDPWQCTFQAASTFEEDRPSGYYTNENLARVVAYNDSFDVFYPSLRTCGPCRYSIDGKRIDLQHQLQVNHTLPEVTEFSTFFRIQTLSVPGHQEIRYFYVYNFGNGSSVIKLLDENFHAVKQRYLDHAVDVIASDQNIDPFSLHICYKTNRFWMRDANDTVYCKVFSDDLELLSTTRLPVLKGHAPDTPLALNVNYLGESFVSVAQSLLDLYYPTGEKTVFYWVNSTGELIDVDTLYELPSNNSEQYEVRGFFVDKKTYCIEHTSKDYWWPGGPDFVKCIIISGVIVKTDV